MEIKSTRDYLELWWLPVDQDDGIDADYCLSDGREILGTVKWETEQAEVFARPDTHIMTATTGDGVWMFWKDWQYTTIHHGETGKEIASFMYGRGEEGLLAVHAGNRYTWDKRRPWQRQEWGWFRMDEKALVYVERCGGWFAPIQVNVAIMPSGRDCSDLGLLLTLGLPLALYGGRDSDGD
jgi:hypothetical protein